MEKLQINLNGKVGSPYIGKISLKLAVEDI